MFLQNCRFPPSPPDCVETRTLLPPLKRFTLSAFSLTDICPLNCSAVTPALSKSLRISSWLISLKELPKLGYIDMGMMSDLPRARKTFSTARRAVMYSPVKLKDADLPEIRTDMEKIYRELSPCDIVTADVQFDTPDKRVNDLLDICGNLEAH